MTNSSGVDVREIENQIAAIKSRVMEMTAQKMEADDLTTLQALSDEAKGLNDLLATHRENSTKGNTVEDQMA